MAIVKLLLFDSIGVFVCHPGLVVHGMGDAGREIIRPALCPGGVRAQNHIKGA